MIVGEDTLSYHAVQTIIGASSAHPGAFPATLAFLAHLAPDAGARVLEVGCGTGRTACLLAQRGCRVTGLDADPVMLAKARVRAEREGALVDWCEGDFLSVDLAALAPGGAGFDLIVAESVTIFNPIGDALAAYHRALAPGGRAADLELAALPGLPPDGTTALCQFFGFSALPTVPEWQAAYVAAGFSPVELWRAGRLNLRGPRRSAAKYPDQNQVTDLGALEDPRVNAVLLENGLLMVKFGNYLGSVGVVATRA